MSSSYRPAYDVNSKYADRGEKEYKRFIKRQIDCETDHRKKFERENEIWGKDSMRGQCLALANYDADSGMFSTMIHNANGIQGNHKSLKELCAELAIKDKATYERYLDYITSPIKPSRWKEKFYRYIHLRDKDNALKYHNKLWEHQSAEMENIREAPEKYGIYIDNTINGTEATTGTGEGGYLAYCKEMKRSYDNRIDHLKFLDARKAKWD